MQDKTYEEHLAERQALNYQSTKRWSKDYARVGMIGERELARFFDLKQDLRSHPNGDGGVDQPLKLSVTFEVCFACDVKGAQSAPYLLVDVEKVKPLTIYVLCEVDLETDSGKLLGWQWGNVMMKAPTEDWCGNGVIVHKMRAGKLRKMDELLERQVKRA